MVECTLGISPAPAFADDFPSYAHKFNQRTFHVRLINLCTSDKKSSHKIRRKETPRVYRGMFLIIPAPVLQYKLQFTLHWFTGEF